MTHFHDIPGPDPLGGPATDEAPPQPVRGPLFPDEQAPAAPIIGRRAARRRQEGGERTLTVAALLRRENLQGVWVAPGMRMGVTETAPADLRPAAEDPGPARHPRESPRLIDRVEEHFSPPIPPSEMPTQVIPVVPAYVAPVSVPTAPSPARAESPTPTVAALDFPEPRILPETSFAALWRQSLIQSRRLLLRWTRDPFTTIQALVYPAVTLVMLWVVLSDSIERATGMDALDGLVPMSILVGSMAGAVAGAVSLIRERKGGLVARFAVLPTHRAAPIVGRLLADSVRILLTSILLVLTGLAIGFEFRQGLLAAAGMLLVPMLFGLSYSVMATAAAVMTTKTTFVEVLSLSTSILMFFNTGFVPIDSHPSWLQDPVRYQPMSCAIDTMRGLSADGPVLTPLLWTLGWTTFMLVAFTIPAVRGYARAATER